MLAVKGYFDGNNYIVEENVVVKPNQRVIITFLDDDFDASATSEKKRAFDELHRVFGTMTHEEAEDIRNNRVNFKERF